MKREFVTLALAGVVPRAVALQGIVPRSTPTPQAIIAFVSTQRLSMPLDAESTVSAFAPAVRRMSGYFASCAAVKYGATVSRMKL